MRAEALLLVLLVLDLHGLLLKLRLRLSPELLRLRYSLRLRLSPILRLCLRCHGCCWRRCLQLLIVRKTRIMPRRRACMQSEHRRHNIAY